jgi:hypothetical protein
MVELNEGKRLGERGRTYGGAGCQGRTGQSGPHRAGLG